MSPRPDRCNRGLTEQDKKIIGYAHESGKGLIIAVNKWIW